MQLSKTCRWVPRSAKGFEPFSSYRGFTGSAISFAVSRDGWPVKEACVVRVPGGGRKISDSCFIKTLSIENLGVRSRDIRMDIETDTEGE